MIDIGLIGASGYGGLELMRLLAQHPDVRLRIAQSSSSAALPVAEVFPSLTGVVDLAFTAPDRSAMAECAVVFLAVDNGHAAPIASELIAQGTRVIDLSADHRFREASGYDAWYGGMHPAPAQTASAVYGLPELHGDAIAGASVVGNPGCYATASILALAPLVALKAIAVESIVLDGKSGVSGAGRSSFGLGTHFAEVNEAVTAYKVGGTHRHTGEIEQELSGIAGHAITVSFTPHLIPMTRGILVSAYASLTGSHTTESLRELYAAYYAQAPFVQIVANPPSTKHTVGTNRCHLSIAVDGRTNRVSVFAALDNLGKGMAGQAIQNLNLMCRIPQTQGLIGGAMWP